MNRSMGAADNGFTWLEILVVISIIGVLATIALPHYVAYREKSMAVSCQSNRRNIEMAETAHFLENSAPGLSVDETWQCPSGGTYVWLISDPEDPDYPRVACSIHYIGSDELPAEAPETPAEATDPGTEAPAEATGATDPSPEAPVATPALAMDDLAEYVLSLGLESKTEGKLIKELEKALADFQKEKINNTDKSLSAFLKEVDKNSQGIDDGVEAVLKQKVTEIQEMLRQ